MRCCASGALIGYMVQVAVTVTTRCERPHLLVLRTEIAQHPREEAHGAPYLR